MWFYAEKWYQKLPFRDRPLFSRLDAPLVDSSFQFTSNTPFFNSALNKINLNHYLRYASLYFQTKLFNVCFFFTVLRNYNLFCTNFVKFFPIKTLRTNHEFCVANLPYHNEDVKKFNENFQCGHVYPRRQRYPTFLVFHFVPSLAQDISQTFWYFAIKFSKVKEYFISNNPSK